jgi:hypothetical protein
VHHHVLLGTDVGLEHAWNLALGLHLVPDLGPGNTGDAALCQDYLKCYAGHQENKQHLQAVVGCRGWLEQYAMTS